MPHCPLSIVVPCYNIAATLIPLVERIAAALTSRSDTHEVLLVNDGSPDPETWSVMERLAGRFGSVRAFDLAGNQGQTAATLYGMSQARGDVVVTMDADLQHPPEEIARLIEPLACTSHHFVGCMQQVARRWCITHSTGFESADALRSSDLRNTPSLPRRTCFMHPTVRNSG